VEGSQEGYVTIADAQGVLNKQVWEPIREFLRAQGDGNGKSEPKVANVGLYSAQMQPA
jgi:hypothetical protein